jgi:hypothetical protein
MSAVAAVLLALCAQDGLARVQAALDAGDFAAAWGRQAGEPDPLMAARGRCEILYRAGDPAGALAAATHLSISSSCTAPRRPPCGWATLPWPMPSSVSWAERSRRPS